MGSLEVSVAKGMFTQGVVVLFEEAPSLDQVESALSRWEILKRLPETQDSESWPFGGPSVVLPMRPEVNGRVVVDVVARPWPDSMGDPKENAMVFGAWSMGHFGPLAFPGNLERASQHTWSCPGAAELAARHTAFARIRVTYVGGDDDPVMPEDYDPIPELLLTDDVALALVSCPGALVYFNPNGESLLSPSEVRERSDFARQHEQLPIDVWSNIRLLRLNEEWMVMDTVGLGQLDRCDIEACFPDARFDCGEVDRFLRNASLYLIHNGEVIQTGETMDGPGGIRWDALVLEEGIMTPPRRVLRFLPQDGSERPPQLFPG